MTQEIVPLNVDRNSSEPPRSRFEISTEHIIRVVFRLWNRISQRGDESLKNPSCSQRHFSLLLWAERLQAFESRLLAYRPIFWAGMHRKPPLSVGRTPTLRNHLTPDRQIELARSRQIGAHEVEIVHLNRPVVVLRTQEIQQRCAASLIGKRHGLANLGS